MKKHLLILVAYPNKHGNGCWRDYRKKKKMQKKKVYTTQHKKKRRHGQKMTRMTAITVTVMTEGTVTAEEMTAGMTGGTEIEDRVGGIQREGIGIVREGVKVLEGVIMNQGLKMSLGLPA